MIKHWKAILGVSLIFILGFGSGVVCSSIFVHRKLTAFMEHPGAVAEATLENRLTRNLDLDDQQKQQIHSIFMANLQRRRELNKQIQPDVRAVNLQTFQEISQALRPEQKERFRQNIEEFRNRFGKAAARADTDNLPPPGNSGPAPAPAH